MLRVAFLGCVLILPPLFTSALEWQLDSRAENIVPGNAQIPLGHQDGDYRPICHSISRSISPASEFFYPNSPEFAEDIAHMANSSSQISACSVRPGTVDDLGLIVRELGSTRTPFAIKCSGYTTNPSFSSTPGVQISMTRFREIVLKEEEGTVEIGAGLSWIDVHSYLVPKGLNVVGSRAPGVGVSGHTLAGGYSWKTNQFGLTIDTVTAFELVLPNGHAKVVTEKDEDLWFALRGGLNNYGIVTKYTLKTHRQIDVWGATLTFEGDQIEPAYTTFSQWLSVDHDRKSGQTAQLIYNNGMATFKLILFYDGPKLPEDLYNNLLNLPNTAQSIIEGDFLKFLSHLTKHERECIYTDGFLMPQYSVPVLEAAFEVVKTFGSQLGEKDKDAVFAVEFGPFESDIFTHGGPSAYPPDRSRVAIQSVLFVRWNDESLDKDKYVYNGLRSARASIIEAGIMDGQDLKNVENYPNLALYGTPLEEMYGNNVGRLREIRKKYDPFHVMGLTGGFKI